MNPSKYHSNRRLENWLLYTILDRYLLKYSQYLTGHLVDLGCGEATYKQFFLTVVERYTGVDWSKSLHNCSVDVESDLNAAIELDDSVADSIISLSVMEHLCEPQVFLNESYRILKNGGCMLLQVPWQWRIHEAPHDYYRYTPFGLKYMFEKAGFENIEVEATCGFFTTMIIKANYFSTRLIRGPRVIKRIIRCFFAIFWTLGQLLAPYLDKLDRNWQAESQGYFVLARKPN